MQLIDEEQAGREDIGSPGASDTASSASKALGIIKLLVDSEGGVLRLTDVARGMGVPKSTAHRILKVLEAEGFVERRATSYCLGAKTFELGQAARWSVYGELRDLAAPFIDELFERLGETVHLAVPEGVDVMYLEKISASGGSRIPSRVGSRMPLTCTAVGKAILAHGPDEHLRQTFAVAPARITQYSLTNRRVLLGQLDLAREEGVAYELEESRLGVTCVAAPIRVDGVAVAAVSVAGPTNRFEARAAASAVRNTAGRIERRIAEVEPVIARLDHQGLAR